LAIPIAGQDGLVSHGLYRFSRNPQYASSILGLIGLAICANSWLVLPLAVLMSGAYVLMALTEETWLEQRYGAPYRDYCARTARFMDVSELIARFERKRPSHQTE
jgi:protein-S-isoprenylcysteine O-methyltransferase Ste14